MLTDPNFLHQWQHGYMGFGLVTKRLGGPPLRVQDLPPVDPIALSQLHGDTGTELSTADWTTPCRC